MERSKIEAIKESYSRLKNLKLVGKELKVPWQTVYWHLRKEGVPVTGDKSRYGSSCDKLAVIGEDYFDNLIPYSENQNKKTYQSKYDFIVKGLKVDVKTSRLKAYRSSKNRELFNESWKFSIKKHQHECCDLLVLVCLKETSNEVEALILVPVEMVMDMQSITIPHHLKSKWSDFLISEKDLKSFFDDI